MAVPDSSLKTDGPPAACVRRAAVAFLMMSAIPAGFGASVCSGDERPQNGWMISARTAGGLGGAVSARRDGGHGLIDGVPESWRPEVPPAVWKYVVVHHSGTPSGSVETIHAEHSRRRDATGQPWLGIGYHFVIGNGRGMEDGRIEPTFRWQRQIHGAHSGHELFNARGIGVCLIGNFEYQRPTRAQWNAVCRLIESLLRDFDLPVESITGHSMVSVTACPGRYLSVRNLRDAVTRRIKNSR